MRLNQKTKPNKMFNNKIELQQSYGHEPNQNSTIHGDNLQVLDLMQSTHSESIKCVYIDPPYNTGQKFENYDDAISDDEWVNGLRCLLSKIKPLLSKDGSVWISINDNNLHYLKVMADSIFGRENFIHTIVWEHKKSRDNRPVFSRNHEYILLYARDATIWKKTRNTLPDSEENLKLYKNVDEKRGLWRPVCLTVPSRKSTTNQFYEIESPNGKVHKLKNGRAWVISKEIMEQEIKKDNIYFGKDGNSIPSLKKFLSERTQGMTPETLWVADDVGTTTIAKKHVISLMGEGSDAKIFDTPKPEQLISRIIQISTNEGDLVLDPFLGSGTTASVCHKMNRNYIGIEYMEPSIHFINQRLQKVIDGENGGISESLKWDGGGGFSFYTLTE